MPRFNLASPALLLLFCASLVPTQAQYFGRNKPKYEHFDFKVVQTPHFDLYQYAENPALINDLASQAEHWYRLHQAVLLDTFSRRNPLIFYSDHADFQQTNAIMGELGIGTGGVTEALKNRVIIPLAMSNAQTRHVLGHELVHAFQYHMILDGDSTSIQNLSNLPLWMIEGLAEYLSIGRTDPNTALWMRDAVINDKIPSLRDLEDPSWFPYRWGQAFWAFVTGWKGDQVIQPLFVETAKRGFPVACKTVLGVEEKELSKLWVESLKLHYEPFLGDKKERFVGKPFITEEKGGGRLNISPMLSPDGRYLLFLSERDVFSIDVYLADAASGNILRKVHSATQGGYIDEVSNVENTGTWAPDSKQFALTGVSKGDNILIIKNIAGKTTSTFTIPGVPAFSNPAWAPDGKSIVVAGLVNGQTDLFQVNLSTRKVTRLTNDRYSEIMPSWSTDGRLLAYATDELSFNANAGPGSFSLAIREMPDGKVQHLDLFPGANNLNPVFDAGGNLLFLSDRDGFRNLYRYESSSGKVFQMTRFLTGITGITPFSPAITASVKENRDRVFFTHYFKGKHQIYRARMEDFAQEEVPADSVDLAAAGLPRINEQAPDLVNHNLALLNRLPQLSQDSLRRVAYHSKFRLDYIAGGGGVGIGTGGMIGGTTTGLAGGVDMIFSDMLGDHQVFSSVFLNGEIYDFGAAAAYINQKHQFKWGVGLSHQPMRSGWISPLFLDTLTFEDGTKSEVLRQSTDIARIFEEKINVFTQYPFSRTLRVEGGASFSYYSNRLDRYDNYYSLAGSFIGQEHRRVEPEEVGLSLFEGALGAVNFGLVGDNSVFGMASPAKGLRFRLGGERYFGDFSFYNLTADARKYVFIKPFTLAGRLMHYGRYGRDANLFYPIFLGFPWYIRGYEYNNAIEVLQQNGRSVDELFGSKIVVANAEVRLPFTGPEQLALIPSRYLFTELSFFADAGLAWDVSKSLSDSDLRGFDLKPLYSAGVSLRFNLFGALVLEPYYAWPLLQDTKGTFGLNIVPGW